MEENKPTPEQIKNALKKAKSLVYEARATDKKIYDIVLGEILVKILSEDPYWVLDGLKNRERRMYHLLYSLAEGDTTMG
jgi:hypothetical protein